MPSPVRQYGERPRLALPAPKPARRAAPLVCVKSKIEEIVLGDLGRPDDLFRVDIKPLHDRSHFRVNIYREIGSRIRMTDSYYVVFEAGGKGEDVVQVRPPIRRRYFDDVISTQGQDAGSCEV